MSAENGSVMVACEGSCCRNGYAATVASRRLSSLLPAPQAAATITTTTMLIARAVRPFMRRESNDRRMGAPPKGGRRAALLSVRREPRTSVLARQCPFPARVLASAQLSGQIVGDGVHEVVLAGAVRERVG